MGAYSEIMIECKKEILKRLGILLTYLRKD